MQVRSRRAQSMGPTRVTEAGPSLELTKLSFTRRSAGRVWCRTVERRQHSGASLNPNREGPAGVGGTVECCICCNLAADQATSILPDVNDETQQVQPEPAGLASFMSSIHSHNIATGPVVLYLRRYRGKFYGAGLIIMRACNRRGLPRGPSGAYKHLGSFDEGLVQDESRPAQPTGQALPRLA